MVVTVFATAGAGHHPPEMIGRALLRRPARVPCDRQLVSRTAPG
jgi:hypothetical protein